MFIGGFALHSLVFLDQTFVDPFFRGVFQKNESSRGTDARKMQIVGTFIEWLLHLAVITFTTGILFLTMHDDSNSTSIGECMGVYQLGPERKWLINLAIA